MRAISSVDTSLMPYEGSTLLCGHASWADAYIVVMFCVQARWWSCRFAGAQHRRLHCHVSIIDIGMFSKHIGVISDAYANGCLRPYLLDVVVHVHSAKHGHLHRRKVLGFGAAQTPPAANDTSPNTHGCLCKRLRDQPMLALGFWHCWAPVVHHQVLTQAACSAPPRCLS